MERIIPQVEYPPEPEPLEPDPHYEDWSDEDVAAEYAKVSAEHHRRQAMVQAQEFATRAMVAYQAAAGIRDGMEWTEPAGYLDAVQPGHTRVFEGDLYRVTADHPVTHSPAQAPELWELIQENVDPVEPDPDDYPHWEPDLDIEAGSIWQHDGGLWEATQDHRSQPHWAPTDGTYLWRRV